MVEHDVASVIKSSPMRQTVFKTYPAFEDFAQFDEGWKDAGLQNLWSFIDRRLAKHSIQ